MGKTILLTGAAGFIGSHTAEVLVASGDRVIGLDNLNVYYDSNRKRANLIEIDALISQTPYASQFTFREGDIRDTQVLHDLFEAYQFDAVVHLAAMAGVRASIKDPRLYYDVNVTGTLNLLEATVGRLASKQAAASRPNFVFASTSSVYGNTKQIPFVEHDLCDRPLAPYASSKRAGELLGFTYHHLYGLPFTALRFFTVYGPRGRPDMMAYKVLDNIFFDREVPLYHAGQMHRDWTYVSDIVKGVVAAIDCPLGYAVLNLGRGQPVLLADFVQMIEKLVGRPAHLVPAPMPETDIASTYADISKTHELLGYNPQTSVQEGVIYFWEWYQRAVLKRL